MSILCLGVNHKTAPVEIRERFAFSDSSLAAALAEILKLPGIEETVVLSTCNRVEVYAGSGETVTSEVALQRLRQYLLEHFEIGPENENSIMFYEMNDEEAAKHLFQVASGLDSMVLGETEIFGQVKKAYSTSQAAGTTARRLNKLFQQSFRIGKLIRSSTEIQRGPTSIGSVAVELAEKIFGRLKGCQVMLIGAGEMSRVVAQSLQSRGAKSIIVSNRSYDKAEELAAMLEGEAVRFDEWEKVIKRVDIVITSTSAPHYILKPEMIEHEMSHRRRPLFVIDIAVPRDVDPAVNEIDNVYLYDIDQLQAVATDARSEREKQIKACLALIDAHLADKGIDALRGS